MIKELRTSDAERERRRVIFARTLFPDRVGRKKKKWLETFTATKCRFFKSKASVFYEDIFSRLNKEEMEKMARVPSLVRVHFTRTADFLSE